MFNRVIAAAIDYHSQAAQNHVILLLQQLLKVSKVLPLVTY